MLLTSADIPLPQPQSISRIYARLAQKKEELEESKDKSPKGEELQKAEKSTEETSCASANLSAKPEVTLKCRILPSQLHTGEIDYVLFNTVNKV